MASTDAKPVPQKNVAYRAVFPILDADGDLVTGAAALDSEVSKDQGTFADCTNEATEIATASGMYYLDLTATEMNADCVAIIVKTSTTGAKTTVLVFYPEEAGDIRVNVTQLNGTGQTGRDIGASVLLSPGTGAGQISLTSGAVTVGTNNDKTGYSLSQAFPANFSSMSITAGGLVDVTQAAADKVWSTTTRRLSDGTNIVLAKGVGVTGFNDLSAAQVNAEADTALADVGLTTTITGRIDAAVSSRMATFTYTAPDNAGVAAIKAKTDQLTFTSAGQLDVTLVNMTAAGAAKFFSVNSGTTYGASAAGSVVKEIVANVSGGGPGGTTKNIVSSGKEVREG